MSRRSSLAIHLSGGAESQHRHATYMLLVVVHDPHFAALRLRLAVRRRDLDEPAEWLLALVDLLVEPPVHLERRRELDGADRRLAGGIARDHLRRDGRRRTVDEGRRQLEEAATTRDASMGWISREAPAVSSQLSARRLLRADS